ncbi:MAG: nicotinate-nucleotide--dimethylbenzimidazole phosphoribosyltransferase [Balneolales bacterium]|nr:nicotinate-nucleotide--dimethylbenzimidazole phosphoribosyltransferase [Balneolales bacterium]
MNKTRLEKELKMAIDSKTKPLGALGQLETLAFKLGMVLGSTRPVLRNPVMLVFGADHGIAQRGVSAYPAEVTGQMLRNFATGGAAINVFCRQNGLRLICADAGVLERLPDSYYGFETGKIRDLRAGNGTRDFTEEPAMSEETYGFCAEQGRLLVKEVHEAGSNCVGFGEMGIGNTSSASAVMSALCDIAVDECVGRGTGLDDAGLARKIDLLKSAMKKHSDVAMNRNPGQVLQTFGGFELVMIASGMMEAAKRGMLILVDGFIAGAACLVADKMHPGLREFCVFTHLSAEKAHGIMLKYLDATPLLQLDLRLGEGTGCALAYPLIESAARFLREMASFEEAGVSNKET